MIKLGSSYQVGGLAQLGERLHGMQEVSGSIPLSSTRHGFLRLTSLKGQSADIFQYGGLAQLGERLHGMQEVSGSIPLSSTFRFFGVYVLFLKSVSMIRFGYC